MQPVIDASLMYRWTVLWLLFASIRACGGWLPGNCPRVRCWASCCCFRIIRLSTMKRNKQRFKNSVAWLLIKGTRSSKHIRAASARHYALRLMRVLQLAIKCSYITLASEMNVTCAQKAPDLPQKSPDLRPAAVNFDKTHFFYIVLEWLCVLCVR